MHSVCDPKPAAIVRSPSLPGRAATFAVSAFFIMLLMAPMGAAPAISGSPEPAVALSLDPTPHPALRRATYTWTGNASNDRWDTVANWATLVTPGYPDDCNDDAAIPDSILGYGVELITESIDDLTLEGNVTFSPTGSSNTLTVESLTIGAGTVVTFENGARTETVTSCQ